MPKVAFAASLSVLLLAGCGSRDQESAQNGAAAGSEAAALDNAGSADPAQPRAPENGLVDPVPPPDAVSHPDGYLPLAPGEADPASANAAGSDAPAPATEDEYIRNKQAGR